MAERNPTAHTAPLNRELEDIRVRLETVYAVLVTAIAALKGQGADADSDIARCLMRCALDPLGVQVERLQSLVRHSRHD